MYERANAEINRGLSFGARLLLGFVAGLFGLIMVLTAPVGESRAIGFYGFGFFCLLISIACFTSGRVRQFIGSLIGCAIFAVGVAYLVAELFGGPLWSGRRSSPFVFNAVMYLLFIGIPGVVYAYKARFGFRKGA
jgi:hypothetical protein